MGFLTFFNSKKETIQTDSEIRLRIQEFAKNRQLIYYKSIPIFHRHEKEHINSFILDSHRGMYFINSVDWRLKDIEDATISLATPDKKDSADIQVDSVHKFIKQKFNEILHTEGCALTNILVLNHITKEHYEELDESFHKLMPKERLIFADDTDEDIEKTLHCALEYFEEPLETSMLLGALFFHLNIMPDNLHKNFSILTQEQYDFVSCKLPSFSTLSGTYGTGKTSLILLKAIYELLINPEYKIVIIMPTLAVCDMLKKELLDIIEYAIIDIDLLSIQILSPQQLIAQHHQKLYKNESFNFAKITPKMFSNQSHSADILFCDDSYLLDDEFIRYIKKQQSKKKLSLVTKESLDGKHDYHLTHLFRSTSTILDICHSEKPNSANNIHLLEGNAYMHIMVILRDKFTQSDYPKILIAAPYPQFALKILDEINSYYGKIAILFKSDEGLLNQELEHIMIASIDELSHLQREHVIVVKDENTNETHLCHAIGRAAKSLYLISSTKED